MPASSCSRSAARCSWARQTASIPYLLGKDRAKGAVAALQATEQGVNLVAPPIGGALFGLLGPLPALAINALTYLTSQVAIASVRTFGPDQPGRLPSLRQIGGDVATGWRFVFADRTMMLLSFTSCAYNFVGSIGYVALIPYFKRAFFAGDQVIGLAFGCFSAGAALGSFVAGRTHWAFGPAVIIANLADGFGWLPLPWTHSIWTAIAGVAFSSFTSGYAITTIVSWRLRVIPEEYVGPRVRRRAAHRARRRLARLDLGRLVRRPHRRARDHDDLGARLHGVHVRARVLTHRARGAPLRPWHSTAAFTTVSITNRPDSAQEHRRAGNS